MFFKEQNPSKPQAEKPTSSAGESEPVAGPSRSYSDDNPVAGPSNAGSSPKSSAYKLSEVSVL